ncbi:cytotoxic and regulatory T-cell molecule [Danio aesculapii]|uniref:cytotoxic and regulatory T-cell molecule n=1 Tax=Danio aesculapii TaxID=1142201 RepID=UPI0024C0E2B7|nr:cytotoxic and regulatory T-cell molecule [Danio aesculapii]
MEIKKAFVIHFLMLITAGLRECLATKFITVVEGDTLVLKCPRRNLSENVHMEWRKEGHVMFFNTHKGLKDPRINLFTSNTLEFTVVVSNVTFKDEGLYRCFIYEDQVSTKRFKVKVLGSPKIDMTEHEGKAVIKCSTAANGHPPKLSWQIGGVEVEAVPNTWLEERSNRTFAVSILTIKTHIREATVKCLAKHRELPNKVMNFIVIQNHSIISSTTSIYSTRDDLKTETIITATSPPVISSTAPVEPWSVSESTEVFATEDTTSKSIQVEEHSTESDISLTTHDITSSESNSTDGFVTKNVTNVQDFGDKGRQYNQKQSSPLLILLVTTLIICLLIVVIFFLIRLRRAHVAWKKENEESDQSVESSKSKASHEEKQAHDRRRQGFWNSNFTVYKVEDPPQNTTVSVATIDVISEAQDNSRTACNQQDKACVKETEL